MSLVAALPTRHCEERSNPRYANQCVGSLSWVKFCHRCKCCTMNVLLGIASFLAMTWWLVGQFALIKKACPINSGRLLICNISVRYYYFLKWPIIKLANSTPIRSCASLVAAPMCGVSDIFGCDKISARGIGSLSNTSNAAYDT